MGRVLKPGEEELTGAIIGTAIQVHKHWGPGLYEQVYERSLCRELEVCGLPFQTQCRIAMVYRGREVGGGLRLDLWVNRQVVVEVKAVADLLPVHEAQLLTYLRLTGSRVGLLINFNVTVLRKGLRRMVL